MADHAVRRFRLQTGLRLDAHRTALPIRWCTWWGVVTTDGLFVNNFDQIGALAQRYSVPAMFQFREFAAAGGLMSYGTRFGEGYHEAGILAGRILRGEKPADLPVMQSTKFELVINRKAARALGLSIPPTLLSVADEMIE